MTAYLHTAGQSRRSLSLKLDKSTSFPLSFDKAAHETRTTKRLLSGRAAKGWAPGLRSQQGLETPAPALG